jgi:anhydro-N-acetylmuramic acid kinase
VLSGTSADGAEAAVCRVRGTGGGLALELLAHHTLPFSAALTGRILAVATPGELCELSFELGERFAEAVLAAVEAAGLSPAEVDAVGSHGQTVAHHPPGLAAAHPSTLQVGQPAVIAERTGIPVVADFRVRDVAAGGQGAPLVPYFDWAVLRDPGGSPRAFQNLGGIGNLSVVSARLEDTLAFDTGPGNMVLDGLVRRATGGARTFDRDGALARQGRVLPGLLAELLRHPFLAQPPPRSAGREGFGEALVERVWATPGARPEDLLATAAAFTVEATARAFEAHVLPRRAGLAGVWVSGGGCRNPVLMEGLAARLAPLPVQPLDALGFPEGAKEAACFALLAAEFLAGTPTNVLPVTGARRQVVLGTWVP